MALSKSIDIFAEATFFRLKKIINAMSKQVNEIKIITILGLGLVSCSKSQDRPNIVYVFPDQFRNCALSFWNEPEYEGAQNWKADPSVTPNLNAFASEAVVLSRAMSTCPLSSPYRGMFLSGMYPERNGVLNNCISTRVYCDLRQDAVCISDVLSSNGYSCGYIGKLHTDLPTKNDPDNPGHFVSDTYPEWDAYTPAERRHGFDYWYSYGAFNQHKNPHYWDTDGHKHEPHEFSVKHDTDKAIEYLRNENGERDARKPFFLCVAYLPPHSPYASLDDCMEEDFRLYADKSLKDLYVRENADTAMAKAKSIRYYLANVTAVDREFGRILSTLKELGLDKNTIVVFTSDHGETMCSHSTKDPKNSIWTESFNVPFLIRYPGRLAHRVDSVFMTPVDIMPTLLSLCGMKDKIPASVEGSDLSGILEGKADERPEAALYIHNVDAKADSAGFVHDFFPDARGLRTDRYTMEIAIDKKYNLKSIKIFDDWNDPYQMENLYEDHPELLNELLPVLQRLLQKSNDIWYREQILDRLNIL